MNPSASIVNGILARDGRVFIARRSLAKKVAPGKYHLPGGHIEDGETPESAIVREFLEEFAIDVRLVGETYDFSYRDGDETTNGICFVLSWGGDISTIEVDPSENDEVRWTAKEELGEYFESTDHNRLLLERYFAEINNLR